MATRLAFHFPLSVSC